MTPFAPPPRPSLVCGAAPAVCLREIAREGARALVVERAISWIARLARAKARLRTGPLFGPLLGELTTDDERSEVVEDARPRRAAVPRSRVAARPRTDLPAFASERRRRDLGPDGPAQDARSNEPSRLPPPHGLARTASPSLLATLAGRAAAQSGWPRLDRVPRSRASHAERSDRRVAERAFWPPPDGRAPRHLDRPSGRDRRQGDAARTDAPADSHARHEVDGRVFATRLVRRTERLLDVERARAAATSGAYVSWLRREWTAPVGGPAAPADLLVRAAATHSTPSVRDPRRAASGVAGDDRDLAPRDARRPSARDRTPASPAAPAAPGAAISRRPAFVSHPEAPPDTPSAVSDAPPSEPPGGSDSLPPGPLPSLVARQAVGAPPIPVARTEARHAAFDDEGDDLDTLAAKIKRILDDQARRHGIDV